MTTRSGSVESMPVSQRIDVRKIAAIGARLIAQNTVLSCKGNIVSLSVDIAHGFLEREHKLESIESVEEAYTILENLGLQRMTRSKLPPSLEALITPPDKVVIPGQGE